jgi:hypothetical protein
MYRRTEHHNLRTAATIADLDYWFGTCLLRGLEVIWDGWTIYEAARLRRAELAGADR